MSNNMSKGLIDIPLSCSSFLEPALNCYQPFAKDTPQETKDFIHQWNYTLADTVKDIKNNKIMGEFGQYVFFVTLYYPWLWQTYINASSITDSAMAGGDMPSWSLLYAIRFKISMDLLKQKQSTEQNIKLLDFGCGLSPTAVIAKNQMDIQDTYCIELYPEICDIYQQTADKMGIKSPTFIKWKDVLSNKINTVISMGVFPYMTKSDQLKHFETIYKNIPNFAIEIKYNANTNTPDINGFSNPELQKIAADMAIQPDLHKNTYKNATKYLNLFCRNLPVERSFIQNHRSLFLSR